MKNFTSTKPVIVSKIYPVILLSVLTLFFASCGTNTTKSPENQANAKIDSSYAMIADLTIEQYKLANKSLNDEKLSAAIQAYNEAKTNGDKEDLIKKVDKMTVDEDNLHRCPKTITMGSMFTTYLDSVSPAGFDQAVLNNDMVVAQVKLVNSYFNELDNGTVTALAYYEKLSKEEKIKLFLTPGVRPVPPTGLVNQFLQAYYLQRYLQQQRLQTYMQRTRYINEFPQGFVHTRGMNRVDDKQFDQKVAIR